MRTIDLDYFIALEEDVLRTSRYVEFTQDNFDTYSVEFVRLLLAAGSEVDVAAKALIHTFNPRAKPRDINDYRKHLLREFPEIEEDIISCPRFGLSLHPWKDWRKAHPEWWRAYNNVKHDRLQFFEEASLKNVLIATCGLGVIMQYFGRTFGLSPRKNFKDKLFKLNLAIITRPDGWKPPES